jgi:hypothetical protein
MSKKNSSYKVMAEAIASGKLENFSLPTSRIDLRRLSIDEIKEYIVEEFGKAKKASDEKVKEPEKGWGDCELVKQIEWVKALSLKEFFDNRKK